MKRGFLISLSILILSANVRGQGTGSDPLLESIAYHSDIMVNAVADQHRIKAHAIFQATMDTLLARPGSYNVPLDSIPWIAVVHGDDFRIVTWQLRLSDSEYKYGGFIQWPDRIVKLNDSRPWLNGAAYSYYTPDLWYGCLYYNIIPFENEGKKYYALFGFNAENAMNNTKVADILDLTGDSPKLGLPLFVSNEEARTRIIITYADVSSVHLVYDTELKAIVHDHLSTLPGIGPSGEALAVSDGSLEGWFLKDGKWVYEEEVYDVKMEEPPMLEERKVYKEDKDLFGRPKKEK